jgi:triacylglycerol esterase/lipase EstA (alpha/beta hydrolase family)
MEALMPYHPILRRLALAACASSMAALAAGLSAGTASASTSASAGTASASTSASTSTPARTAASALGSLPVDYSFAFGYATTFNSPTVPPPGANNFSCRPSAAHPYPVVLVHGTLENMNDNWQAAAPILANHGYCVFAFNYGGSSATADFQGTGDIAASAQQLATFVNTVLAATGAAKVDLVGHSQGGMMPRYYINFLGGAAKVDKLIGLAPSNYGTTLDGLTALGQQLGLLAPLNGLLSTACAACVQQEAGSTFLSSLNENPTVPAVQYTVIETRDDEVVTPYTNAFLPAASNVTNITVQQQCALDGSDHLELANDPIAMADMLNALDPADPVKVPCLVVLPVTGPVGPVPSF